MKARIHLVPALLLVVAGVVAGLLLTTLPVAQAVQTSPTRAGFEWEMQRRFGVDVDSDGRIEIENTHEYAHGRRLGSCVETCPAPRFLVHLSASPSAAALGVSRTLFTYEWRIDGPGGAGVYHRTGPALTLLLPEGEHDVDVRVRVRVPFGSVTLRSRGSMEVDDLVVVALGDSMPGGEGSPEVPRRDDVPALWADASDPATEERHAITHRSSVGWASRVALALEGADPHTSVTFIDLAASGARIDTGILRARPGPGLPAQLDEMRRVVGEREIDLLLLQVGGNDIGFSQVIHGLVDADPLLDPICYDVMLDNVWASARDGRWDRDASLRYDPPFGFGCEASGGVQPFLPGIDRLGAAFARLAAALSDVPIDRVLIVEYPDPTGSSSKGDTCDEIVGDVTAPLGFHEVDENEQELGRARVLGPLNSTIADAAAQHGWILVGGVAEAFAAGHGYCAPWPDYGYPPEFLDAPFLFKNRLNHPEGWYRPPGVFGGPLQLTPEPVSWYRTAAQSAALQGPEPRYRTAGTMHPNELGHMAIARMVLAILAAPD